MAESSAAANRQLFRVAVVVALALLGLLPASARTATRAAPLFQVTPRELRVSQPVTALAADGVRAAFAFCNQLLGVWRPGGTSVVKLGPSRIYSCPPPVAPLAITSLAIASDRIAWTDSEGGNIVDNFVYVANLASPHKVIAVANISHCCRGEPDEQRLGFVNGHGNVVVFGSRYKCGDQGTPSCPSPAPTGFVDYSVWRVRRPPSSTTCINQPGLCVRLASATTALEPLSVGSGRVALLRADGAVVVRSASGALVRPFAALSGRTRAAVLMGNSLVALVPGHVLDFDLATGRQLYSRPVAAVPSGGVCGIPPCAAVSLRMVDAARGLVAYTFKGKLHLLRLRDGANRVVGAANDARFGGAGLFYTYRANGPWPGRIRFLPWTRLPLTP